MKNGKPQSKAPAKSAVAQPEENTVPSSAFNWEEWNEERAKDKADFASWKRKNPDWRDRYAFVDSYSFRAWSPVEVPKGLDLVAEYWSETKIHTRQLPHEALFVDKTGRNFVMFQRGKFRPVSVAWAIGWWERGDSAHEVTGDFDYNTNIFSKLLHEAHRLLVRAEGGAR